MNKTRFLMSTALMLALAAASPWSFGQHALPFSVQKFQPGPEWKGKAVLVELFTGSECPPCAAADLGVDGLIEAFQPKYLAVLEYHLPIPRPDPMMNHATRLRADHYGIRSTPSIFFDGQGLETGGGPKAWGENKYKEYAQEIRQRIHSDPGLNLGLQASLQGDNIQVTYALDKVPDNADFHLALVQKEVNYRGYSGVVIHKMVVREFKTLEIRPGLSGRLSLSLSASEQAALQHLSDFEKQWRFIFKEKRASIDRTQLQVVFFVQDRATNRVYQAAVADVK